MLVSHASELAMIVEWLRSQMIWQVYKKSYYAY